MPAGASLAPSEIDEVAGNAVDALDSMAKPASFKRLRVRKIVTRSKSARRSASSRWERERPASSMADKTRRLTSVDRNPATSSSVEASALMAMEGL